MKDIIQEEIWPECERTVQTGTFPNQQDQGFFYETGQTLTSANMEKN